MGRDHSAPCPTCGCERGGLNDVPCACNGMLSNHEIGAVPMGEAERTLPGRLRSYVAADDDEEGNATIRELMVEGASEIDHLRRTIVQLESMATNGGLLAEHHLAEIQRLDLALAEARAEVERLDSLFHVACDFADISDGSTAHRETLIKERIAALDVHPASFLDCDECRSLSKAGAEPPRCEAFIAMENRRG